MRLFNIILGRFQEVEEKTTQNVIWKCYRQLVCFLTFSSSQRLHTFLGTHICFSPLPISTLAMELSTHGSGHEEAQVADLVGAWGAVDPGAAQHQWGGLKRACVIHHITWSPAPTCSARRAFLVLHNCLSPLPQSLSCGLTNPELYKEGISEKQFHLAMWIQSRATTCAL